MDSIRQRQVREALDYDKNINKAVFAIEKKQVARMADNVLPYSQLNSEATDSAAQVVNSLLVMLEAKRAELRSLVNSAYQARRRASTPTRSATVSLVEEVIQQWNQMVAVFNNNTNTQQTKEAILTSARKLTDLVGFMVGGLSEMARRVERVIRGTATARERKGYAPDAARNHLARYLEALACYSIIQEQLHSGVLLTILGQRPPGEAG
jgi:hypothetical protein